MASSSSPDSSSSPPSPDPSGQNTRMGLWSTMIMIQEWLVTFLTDVLDVLLWIFWGDTATLEVGQSPEQPMVVQAVPGVTTLLDVALFRSVEAELTGTIHTSHTLLQAWLDVQQQARRVLRFCQEHHSLSSAASNSHDTQQQQQQRRIQLESFARVCFDASCDVVERMSTDRLAQTANLTDPFESSAASSSHSVETQGRTASTGSNDGSGGGGVHFDRSSHHHLSNSQQHQEFLLHALHEAAWDTGRRFLPTPQQQPKDCWESSRLHCLDYCWGDEVVGLCHKTLRHVLKHPLVPAAWQQQTAANVFQEGSSASEPSTPQHHYQGSGGGSGGGGSGGFGTGTSSSYWTNLLEQEETKLLLQLVLVDVPTRLTQFKSALEAESVVSKRLYLVKSEYRAPLRAFFEAHSSVQRAPSLELVKRSLKKLTTSSSSSSGSNKRGSGKQSGNFSRSASQDSAAAASNKNNTNMAAKETLQELLERPELVEILAMERQMEQYELDMALALHPFCELSRFLEQKKAAPVSSDTALRNVLTKLKTLLVVAGGSGAQRQRTLVSTGIRPLLLDFQGVPRDEELDVNDNNKRQWMGSAGDGGRDRNRSPTDHIQRLQSPRTMALIDRRLDEFVSQMKRLSKLCSEKQKSQAFYSERSKTTDIDPPMAHQCQKFDGELFKCHFKDWYTMAVRQHELTLSRLVESTTKGGDDNDTAEDDDEEGGMDRLAEEIRKAEMAVSLSLVSTEPALRKVEERVQMITRDRIKRFDILKSSLEDLCLREMNWHVDLVAPNVDQVLELKPTDHSGIPALLGVFGVPLLRAKQVLPLG